MHDSSHTWRGSRSHGEIRVTADQSPIFTQAYESVACECAGVSVHACVFACVCTLGNPDLSGSK